MMKEFKEFLIRGNVVDLAVGIIIGGAFGKIVTSLVNDIIMPPIGVVLAHVDFRDLAITLRAATKDAAGKDVPAVVIGYGAFINATIDFTIVAFVVFLLVKGVNRLYKKAPPPVNTKECTYCCTNIPLKATKCPNCISDLKPA
jgi:large conductance mechanosensitive channel